MVHEETKPIGSEVRQLFCEDSYWRIDTERTFITAKWLVDRDESPRANYNGKRRRSSSEGRTPLSRDQLKKLGLHTELPKRPNPYETEDDVMATLRRLWNNGEGYTYARSVMDQMVKADIPPTSRVFAFFIKFLVREPHPIIHMDTVVTFFNRITNPNIHTWSSLLRALGSMGAWDKVDLCFHSCRSNIRENTKDFPFRTVLYQAAHETISANPGCPKEFSEAVYRYIVEDDITLRTPGDGNARHNHKDKENMAPRNNDDYQSKKFAKRKLGRHHTDSAVYAAEIPYKTDKRRQPRRQEWSEQDQYYDYAGNNAVYTQFQTPAPKKRSHNKIYRQLSLDDSLVTPSPQRLPTRPHTGIRSMKLRRHESMK